MKEVALEQALELAEDVKAVMMKYFTWDGRVETSFLSNVSFGVAGSKSPVYEVIVGVDALSREQVERISR